MATFAIDNLVYEEWLRGQCKVVEEGLQKKHERMADSPIMFLRAT